MPLPRLIVLLFIFTGLLAGCLNRRSGSHATDQDKPRKSKILSPPDSVPVSPEKRAVFILQPIDTLIATILEEEYRVVGMRNPSGMRRGAAEIKIPTHLNLADSLGKDSLIAIAYWIGVGHPPINAYESLVKEIPKEWTQPGITAPLAAYGSGHPVWLPQMTMEGVAFQREVVRYDFVGPSGKKDFANDSTAYATVINREPTRPNYGIISGTALTKLWDTVQFDEGLGKNVLHFYFAYANHHAINSYRIQLKLIAYYQVSEPRKSWKTVPSFQH